jgi:GGDEF domain-containing protein
MDPKNMSKRKSPSPLLSPLQKALQPAPLLRYAPAGILSVCIIAGVIFAGIALASAESVRLAFLGMSAFFALLGGLGFWLCGLVSKAEVKELEAAYVDAETGVANHAFFGATCHQELLTDHPFALAILELPRVRSAKTQAEELDVRTLKRVAQRLAGTIRKTDLVGRMDGARLGILLAGVSNETDAHKVLDRLVDRMDASTLSPAIRSALRVNALIALRAQGERTTFESLEGRASSVRPLTDSSAPVVTLDAVSMSFLGGA